MLKKLRIALFITASLSTAHALAGWQTEMAKPDAKEDTPEVTVEEKVTLPAAPQEQNLVTFHTRENQSFAVDKTSLSIVNGNVVRYTVVATSTSGAKNISYEGIRCSTYEKKTYAFGRADGSWSVSRRDEWDPIQTKAYNLHHASLAYEYFCDGPALSGNLDSIRQRLVMHKPIKTSGY